MKHRKLRKPIALLLVTMMLISSLMITPLLASAYTPEQDAAETLNMFGLLRGTRTDSAGNPVFELGSDTTRIHALIMFLRLIGEYDIAQAGTQRSHHRDVSGTYYSSLVGYAYAKGYTTGISANRFGTNNPTIPAHYLTFILRALGYQDDIDFEWSRAYMLTDQLGITNGEYERGSTELLRGDMAIISLLALQAPVKGANQTLFEKLWDDGVFERLAEAGLITDETILKAIEDDDMTAAKKMVDDTVEDVRAAMETEPEPRDTGSPGGSQGGGDNNQPLPDIVVSGVVLEAHNEIKVTLSADISDATIAISGGINIDGIPDYSPATRTYTVNLSNSLAHGTQYNVTVSKSGYNTGTRIFTPDFTDAVLEWKDFTYDSSGEFYDFLVINYDRKYGVSSWKLEITMKTPAATGVSINNPIADTLLWFGEGESLSANSINASFHYGFRNGSAAPGSNVWAMLNLSERAEIEQSNTYLLETDAVIEIKITVEVDAGNYRGIYTISKPYTVSASDVSRATFFETVGAAARVTAFKTTHSTALALTVETVAVSNKEIVVAALDAYEDEPAPVKTLLSTEKALLYSLLGKINALEELVKIRAAGETFGLTAVSLGLPGFTGTGWKWAATETAETHIYYCFSNLAGSGPNKTITLTLPLGWEVSDAGETNVVTVTGGTTDKVINLKHVETNAIYKIVLVAVAYYDVIYSTGATGTIRFANTTFNQEYNMTASGKMIVLTTGTTSIAVQNDDLLRLLVLDAADDPVAVDDTTGAVTSATSQQYTVYVAAPMDDGQIKTFIYNGNAESVNDYAIEGGVLTLQKQVEQHILILDFSADMLGTLGSSSFRAFRKTTTGTIGEMVAYYRLAIESPDAPEWADFKTGTPKQRAEIGLAFWHFPSGADIGAPPVVDNVSLTDGKSNVYVGGAVHERWKFFIGDDGTFLYLNIVVEDND